MLGGFEYFTARVTRSVNRQEARSRVLKLYLEWLRVAPQLVMRHEISIPPSKLRTKIRQEFEKNRNIQDGKTIDVLIFKGTNELLEAYYGFKQGTHMHRPFDDEKSIKDRPSTFMDKFLGNRK